MQRILAYLLQILQFQLVVDIHALGRYGMRGVNSGERSILADKLCIRWALARLVGVNVVPGEVEPGEVFAEAVRVVGSLLLLARGREEFAAGFGKTS